MSNDELIFKGVFGSHLYGLDTPSSDRDYKSVVVPSRSDLIFNTYKDTVENQTDEVDDTVYALPKFVKILGKCDTVSFDMLHTPPQKTLLSSPLWNLIRGYRSDLYCKNMRGILGYIRTQSSKYGHKVQRYEEMCDLFEAVDLIVNKDLKIKETAIVEYVQCKNYKFIKFTPQKGDVKANVDVLGARYQLDAQVSYLHQGLKSKIESYGKRTKQGSISNGDFKSMSHALRVLTQIEQMVVERDITFPLKERDLIMKVKMAQLTQEDVMSLITDRFDKVSELIEQSDLPEEPNLDNIKNCILGYLFP